MQKWSKEGDFAKALQNGTTLDQQLAAAQAALTTAQAEIEALKEALSECASELWAEVMESTAGDEAAANEAVAQYRAALSGIKP